MSAFLFFLREIQFLCYIISLFRRLDLAIVLFLFQIYENIFRAGVDAALGVNKFFLTTSLILENTVSPVNTDIRGL